MTAGSDADWISDAGWDPGIYRAGRLVDRVPDLEPDDYGQPTKAEILRDAWLDRQESW